MKMIENGSLHHLGYACSSIEEGLKWVKAAFNVLQVSEVVYDPEQNARVCLVTIKNAPNIELVCGKTVQHFITEFPINFYHICYEVENIEQSIQKFIDNGAILLSPPKKAVLFKGRRIAFLSHASEILELLEQEECEQLCAVELTLISNCIYNPIIPQLERYSKKIGFSSIKVHVPSEADFGALLNRNGEVYRYSNVLSILLLDLRHISNQRLLREFTDELITILLHNIPNFCSPIALFLIDSSEEQKIFVEQEFQKLPENKIYYEFVKEQYYATDNYLTLIESGYDYIALKILRIIHYLTRKEFKVIIADCDDTLWTGNCAETDASEILISDTNCQLQRFLKEQIDTGKLLCLCSNNNEQDVLAVFKENKNMLLNLSDITDYEVSWDNKINKVNQLAGRLNLAPDKFIFIDDNPIECALVSKAFPSMLVLQTPSKDSISEFINNSWAFDNFFSLPTGSKRHHFYKQEIGRKKLKDTLKDISLYEYLTHLELKQQNQLATLDDLDRIYELSERSTQFNLTQLPYSQQDLREKILNNQVGIAVLEDKYGSYGLVAFFVFQECQGYLDVAQLVMSCRVIGKGVEIEILAWLLEKARVKRLKEVLVQFKKSERNIPAMAFINKLVQRKIAKKFDNCIKVSVVKNPDINKHVLLDSQNKFKKTKQVKANNDNLDKQQVIVNKQIKNAYFLYNMNGIKDVNKHNDLMQLAKKHTANKNITSTDNLFNAGLTSLHALTFLAEIFQAIGVSLSYVDLLKNPTIKQLDRLLNLSTHTTENTKSLVAIARDKTTYSLNANQLALLIDSKNAGTSTIYNVPFRVDLIGNLNIDAIKQALSLVIKNNEALRTSFIAETTEIKQLIHNQVDIDKIFTFVEAQQLSQHEVELYLNQFLEKNFTLEQPPLINFILAQIDAELFTLLIVAHHAIIDGQSFNIMLEELACFYNQIINSRSVKLIPKKFDYIDYSCWYSIQHKELYKETINYWINQLRDTASPSIYPDKLSIQQAVNGQFFTINFSEEFTRKILVTLNKIGVTPYVYFLGIFSIIIARYTQLYDFIIGSSLTNRNFPESQKIIGYLSYFAPIRCQLDEKLTLSKLLQCLSLTVGEALEHCYLTRFDFLEISGQTRLNSNNLTPVSFTWQEAVDDYFKMEGLKLKSTSRKINISRFDLSLELEISQGKLAGGLYYNANLFLHETIENLVEHFYTLLENSLIAFDSSIWEIEYFSKRQKKFVEVLSNINEPTPKIGKNILQKIINSAKENSENVAIENSSKQISYQELFEQAINISLEIARQGIINSTVGIDLANSPQFYACLLGVLLGGNTFCFIDTTWPEARKKAFISESNCKAIITEKTEAYIAYSIKILIPRLLNGKFIASKILQIPSPAAIAYGIFTSGSTGNPKFIQISSDALNELCAEQISLLSLTKTSRVLQFAARTFDAFIWEFFATILAGATLVLINEDVKKQPKLLGQALKQHQISIVTLPPSFVKLMQPASFSALKILVIAGELIDNHTLKDISKYVNVINAYGLTECTVCSTYKINPEQANNIGRPLKKVNLLILDDNKQLVPIGGVGEVYIGGAFLADNINIMSNSLAGNIKFYKTGDFAKWLPNTEILYVGRKDRQIKLLGNRINLDEIEGHLSSFSILENNRVLLTKDNDGQEQITVFYSLRSNENIHLNETQIAKELSEYLARYLPMYMVVNQFVQLPQLPLTSHSKIDDQQLIKISHGKKQQANLSGKDDIFEIIKKAWSFVLKQEDVAVDINFFDIGGNSLLILNLYKILKEQIEQPFELVDLFNYSTIASLTQFITSLQTQLVAVSSAAQEKPKVFSHFQSDKTAIIGISCDFPNAGSPAEFWKVIVNGKEVITRISPNHSDYNKNFLCVGGLLDNVKAFDADFFKWSNSLAIQANPQLRLLLMHTWLALYNAGYNPKDYSGKIGIFTSVSDNNYQSRFSQSTMADREISQIKLVNSQNFVAGQIAYALQLTGPAININTACSSSLVCLHQAQQALLNGDCDIAVIAVASVILPDEFGYQAFPESSLSLDGTCKPFDINAAGAVPGSGVAVIVLKLLDKALADEDVIDAVVVASSINNDANYKVNYSAPSSSQQAKCILEALYKAGLQPEEISYIETHGTGTKLGDTIELQALGEIFIPKGEATGVVAKKNLYLGSVKANIGHSDVAAGLAGIIKVILMFKHKIIPPQINYHQPNEILSKFSDYFQITQASVAWEKETKFAGISAFGIGGTNAHAILSAPPSFTHREKASKHDSVLSDIFQLKDFWQEKNISTCFLSKVNDGQKIFNEGYLLNLMQNTFQDDSIKMTDNFSALGGDSLLALVLIDKIAKDTGINVKISDFEKSCNLTQFFYQCQHSNASMERLVPLRLNDAPDVVMILVHPGTGVILPYYEFAKKLNFMGSIYAIENLLENNMVLGCEDMKQLAERYLQLCKGCIANAKHVIFSGWSYGASVSYEMARLLSETPHSKTLYNVIIEGWAKQPSYLDDHERLAETAFSLIPSHLKSSEHIKNEYLTLFKHRMNLLKNYYPQPTGVKGVLIKSEPGPNHQEINEPYNHWRGLFTQTINIYRISGNHEDIFSQPYINSLVNAMNQSVKNLVGINDYAE